MGGGPAHVHRVKVANGSSSVTVIGPTKGGPFALVEPVVSNRGH